MDKYIPTGNEYVSLPTINEKSGAIESLSFLYMAQKGMVELRGTPLMRPFVSRGSAELPLTELTWCREHFWVPTMSAKAGDMELTMTILCPVGERGFGIRLQLDGEADGVSFGLCGAWNGTWHCINEDKPVDGRAHCFESVWNSGIVLEYRCGFPVFSLAPITDAGCRYTYNECGGGISYCISADGSAKELCLWWGLGFEEVAAVTSAKEMLRRTWAWEYKKTADWLDKRSQKMQNDKLTELYNTNLFFCIFYATGLTLDTEELICCTSRSSRYYVSAAYWDRDSMLWAFPAILDADPELARAMLGYAFGRQRRNIGTHSRYIDGTVLEPGFELDELVAPVLALMSYIEKTGDRSVYNEAWINELLRKLDGMKHPETALYETFLQPTDDERVYPYITYDNVLVWKMFTLLGMTEKAEAVKQAICEHCVFEKENGRKYFAWSVDLEGQHDVYDEPPGSLRLLPYYGFCGFDDEIWKETAGMICSADYKYSFAGYPIAEIGCPHAPHPWVLSLCNSLLCGDRETALAELEKLSMDNGIACESVDEVSGECTTGAAFATCAGFLCHAMKEARDAK